MRCPTCGTENTPESRFCGGCGAKQFPSEPPRLAPTAKIPDDAPFPQSIPPNTYVAPNYQSSPPSMPPRMPSSGPQIAPSGQQLQSVQPSIPPNNIPTSSLYGRAPTPSPSISRANTAEPERPRTSPGFAEPSMSMPAMPKPRVGLIIAVLVLDLGLATAGALMLGKGLSKSDAPAKPAPTGDGSAHVEAPPPAPGSAAVVAPAPAPSGLPANLPIAQLAGSDLGSDAGSAQPKKKATPPKKDAVKAKKDAPLDPERALASEIDLQAQRSKPELDRCYDDAGGASAVHGTVEIAFRVLPDGRVSNVVAVDNQTGSIQLANCLTGTLAHWSFATHPAKAADFMRPFTYP
jgi:hypothetical protein